MNKIDWHYLKKAILLFVIAIVFSVLIGFGGNYFESKMYDNYQQSVSTLRSTHNLYKNMVNDLNLLEQYRSKFGSYKASGLVGEERRLSWIESLESTNKVIKLPTLTYNLLPQEDFIRPGFQTQRNVVVKSSPMELNMGMLHEEDLFAVLEGLRHSIKNLFTVDSCAFRRLGGIERSLDTKRANIQTNCVIRWVTINDQ